MSKRKHAVEFTVRVTYVTHEIIGVEVPEGADAADAEGALDQAIEKWSEAHPEADEVEGEWFHSLDWAPPRVDEPPESAWGRVGDHEWTVDGYVAIRRDGPRPLHTLHRDWESPGPALADILHPRDRANIEPDRDRRKEFLPGKTADRVAPLFAAGEVRYWGSMALVYRDGDDVPVAIVALERA